MNYGLSVWGLLEKLIWRDVLIISKRQSATGCGIQFVPGSGIVFHRSRTGKTMGHTLSGESLR